MNVLKPNGTVVVVKGYLAGPRTPLRGRGALWGMDAIALLRIDLNAMAYSPKRGIQAKASPPRPKPSSRRVAYCRAKETHKWGATTKKGRVTPESWLHQGTKMTTRTAHTPESNSLCERV